MTEDQKRRADVLLGLMQQAWANMHNRQSFEWKLSLGLWSALGLFISVVLSSERERFMGLQSTGVLLGTIAVLIAIALIHRYWLGQALKRVHFDRDLAIYYEKPIRILAERELTKEFLENSHTLRAGRGWSMGTEWAMTVILCLAAFFSLVAKMQACTGLPTTQPTP